MKIGILYNLVDYIERGFEIDALSDNEIAETVECIQKVLEEKHDVIPVRIRRELLPMLTRDSFDFVFNLCEGIDGNNKGESWIPALLDIIGIPYTGSGSLTLALSRDKIKTKQLLFANNILTPNYQVFYNLSQKLNSNLTFPLIVKPAHEHASVGITIDSLVYAEKDLFGQVSKILEIYQQPAIVEEYIDGRELRVSILGNGETIKALPISELLFNWEGIPKFATYESKWFTNSEAFNKTEAICPANLPNAVDTLLKKLAVESYNLLGCKDYARIDFRVKDNDPYLIDINPNPSINDGITFAVSANVAGVSYGDLIKTILSEAIHRYNLKISSNKKEGISQNGPHITLNSVKLEHVPILTKWFNDSALCKYMETSDTSDSEYSEEKIIEDFIIANHGDTDLIISEKESKKEIGYCSIYDINRLNQSAEISFLIGEKQFQGKGYGTEAVELMLDIAFNKIGLNRIFATATHKNNPSVRILEQTGFRKVGIMRKYHFLNGKRFDESLFEMIRDDYIKKYKKCKEN